MSSNSERRIGRTKQICFEEGRISKTDRYDSFNLAHSVMTASVTSILLADDICRESSLGSISFSKMPSTLSNVPTQCMLGFSLEKYAFNLSWALGSSFAGVATVVDGSSPFGCVSVGTSAGESLSCSQLQPLLLPPIQEQQCGT